MGRKAKVSVDVRESSIRLRFTWAGARCAEPLRSNGATLVPNRANEKRAERLAEEIQRHLDAGSLTPQRFAEYFPESETARQLAGAPESLGSLLKLWRQSAGTKSAGTLSQYDTAVRFWCRELGAETPISSLTHKLIAAKVGCYPWSSLHQQKKYLTALRGALDLEYRGARALENPMTGILSMPKVKLPPDPLTAVERDAVLKYCRAHYDARVAAYFQWMFYTGMRPEEAIALRWSDLAGESIRVQRVRTRYGERVGTKTNETRDVDLVPAAIDAIDMLDPFTRSKGAYIFEDPRTAAPWMNERIQRDKYWAPDLATLGIRPRRAYCTRHTFCTVALMAGVPAAYIAHQAGHTVQVLLDTYAKWIPGGSDGSARRMLADAMSQPDARAVPGQHESQP